MSMTTTNITGHLAMSHTVTAASPTPIALPIASATGPETMSATTTSAASSTITSVTTSCSGLSFQNGRPSSRS